MNGFRDSKEQTLNVASSGLELLKEVKVDAIIGPQKSAQANFLMDLGDKAKVPVISFSATSPSLRPRSPYFIQTGLSDDAQAGAIAAIVESFKCAPNSTFSIPLRIVSRLLQQGCEF
nr:glutamate receptor 2.8-like [Ipomoea batatas]GMD01155.1 glutamate receptor 2.8-like [Ipomoea batatas]GMD09558.1 glutamate receptor 2.8-like [Ipomoea batatas]GMD22942.1 glutamate receptor 2.8-like [Ipomoea batatas]